MDVEPYLTEDALEIGWLYRIDGRNASLGVYVGEGEFAVRRRKFGDVFLDYETHYDQEGTVMPVEKLCMVPPTVSIIPPVDEPALLQWLEAQYKERAAHADTPD